MDGCGVGRTCESAAAPKFLLSDHDADQIIEAQLETIQRDWENAAREVQLTKAERSQLWQRQILKPYIHYDQV